METHFGKAGTRDERTYINAQVVRFGEGEFLHFKLTVSGAEPLFSFACADHGRLSESDFGGHPTAVYEWDLGAEKDERPDNVKDTYGVGMLFTTAVKYTLEVDYRRQNGSVISQLIDVDYKSTAPEDKYREILSVFSI